MSDELSPKLQVLRIQKEIEIKASLATVFESVIEQMSSGFDKPDGSTQPLKLEAWPGGRWYRDLGSQAGHFWGHIQVIKPPTLLEITGPMFMSYPVMSHIQYRLTEQTGGTRLVFIHRAVGEIPEEQRKGVDAGWGYIVEQIKKRSTR